MALDDDERERIAEAARAITRAMRGQGKVVEGGWIAMKAISFSARRPKELEDLRRAFFAGAQHLFSSVMYLLEEGQEATEKDMETMTIIHQELEQFIEQERGRLGWPKI